MVPTFTKSKNPSYWFKGLVFYRTEILSRFNYSYWSKVVKVKLLAKKTEIRQERWHIRRLKNYDDLYAICLTVLLNAGKLVTFYQNVFCFFKIWFWIGQYDPFHMIIDKFYFVFKQFCSLWVLSPWIWNVVRMRFSKKNFMHQLKEWRMIQRYPKYYFFLFFFGLKDPISRHMGLSFKSHVKHLILKVAFWLCCCIFAYTCT